MSLNPNIKIIDNTRKLHSKASEEYLHVNFIYDEYTWDGWIPLVYRRTGLNLQTEEDVTIHLNAVYDQMAPQNFSSWLQEQENFWKEKSSATVTKAFFDSLSDGTWKCTGCSLPQNPNFARRIQDLKEFGYTIATDTNRDCPKCKQKKTHLMLLRIPRGNYSGNGYETFPTPLRKRILTLLNHIDSYENSRHLHCLPDHKFPEIRWDKNTKEENLNSMSDEDIKKKFQLLTNQRNQQKREACRSCFQTGKRGKIFGINFYYAGSENWDSSIPTTGKEAEKGCFGCPWYDIQMWRKTLNEILDKEE